MGRNKTTWDSGSSWRHGKTKVVRIPIALEPQVMNYAREIDKSDPSVNHIPQRAGDILLVLGVIERFIEYKRTRYHSNQHSRELDVSTRAWDELRKLQKLLLENPSALGLTPGVRTNKI